LSLGLVLRPSENSKHTSGDFIVISWGAMPASFDAFSSAGTVALTTNVIGIKEIASAHDLHPPDAIEPDGGSEYLILHP